MVSEPTADRARGRARSRTTAIVQAYRRRRYAWLFASLILTLGAGPTLDTLIPRYNPLELLLALNLLAAIASVAYEGRMRLPYALGAAFIAARVLRAASGARALLAFSDLLWMTAAVLMMATAMRRALRPGVVDQERIMAALDVYLLAGLLFGITYSILEQTWPGSFGGAGPFDLARAIYFSFVTIATLGYGDVVPVSEPARGLVVVEAVSGQMYLAVLVARLVSLYSQQRDD